MDHKKVSVVMPVYNSANHLKATFDSLACQSMDASDFEIICVNDCSTDNSKAVIEQFAQSMPNVILIDLKQNTGAAMIPRNTAIEVARGKYIHFLDSDDFLGEEALERLYNAAEKNESDVVFGRHVGVNGRYVPKSMFYMGNKPKASLLNDSLIYSLAPHKMMRSSFLKDHNIRFHPEAKAENDDQLFVMQCFIKARVITLLDDYDYYFVVARGTESFTSRIFPAKQFLFVPHQIMKFIDEHVQDPVTRKSIKINYINRLLQAKPLQNPLFKSDIAADIKKEWMLEGKNFLDSHLDDEMLQKVLPSNLGLIRALQENDIEAVERIAREKKEKRLTQPKIKNETLVTAHNADIKTYLRPSANAAEAIPLPDPQKPFHVFNSINGWAELRLPDKDGGTYAVFLQKKNLHYSFEYKMRSSFKSLKVLLKGSLKRMLHRSEMEPAV